MSTKTVTTPKVPKKTARNPQHKNLETAMKKVINVNTVLPILEDVLLTPGSARVSDLETDVTVPFDLPGLDRPVAVPGKMFANIMEMMPGMTAQVDENYGVACAEGARKAKVMGENPDNFPKQPMEGDAHPVIGTISEADLGHLATALCFVSRDDLRPAMTGVYFHAGGKKPGKIVGTDAHRLFWEKLSAPLTESFILPAKTARILLAFPGDYTVTAWLQKKEGAKQKSLTHVTFTRTDGVQVCCRVIDAKFPDYQVVIPKGDGNLNLEVDKEFLLKELKNAAKFANRSTNQVTLSMNGAFAVSSQDVDFSFEYNAEFEPGDQVRFTFHAAIPEDQRNMLIAFNAEFLQEIVHKQPAGEPVRIKLWAPTKCAIINDQYLLMPLILGS